MSTGQLLPPVTRSTAQQRRGTHAAPTSVRVERVKPKITYTEDVLRGRGKGARLPVCQILSVTTHALYNFILCHVFLRKHNTVDIFF